MVYFNTGYMRIKLLLTVFAFTFITFECIGQYGQSLKLEILNRYIEKARAAETVQIDLRVKLINSCKDSSILHNFSNFAPAIPFVVDTNFNGRYKGIDLGLRFIIEDLNGKIITPNYCRMPSYANIKDNPNYSAEIIALDTLTLCFIDKKRKSKLVLPTNELYLQNDTIIKVYPLIEDFYTIPRGTYKIYFIYSNNNSSCFYNRLYQQKNLSFQNKIVLSNKVYLIIR